jgi:rod shape-determining protein MreB
MAAAVGAGLDVLKPRGRMLVDVGSGITEAVILSMGQVVSYHALREGGELVNERIVEHMRWAQKLRIGAATAEHLKLAAAAALWTGSQRPLAVRGTSTETRLPVAALVSPSELKHVFEAMIALVADCIEAALHRADPHLATDVCEDGIWLSGGSLLVPGAVHALSQRLHAPVRRVADPLAMVAVGNGKLLASDSLYRATAVS